MEKEIIPLKIVRTKNGKTIFEYATPLEETKNVTGFEVRQEWFNDDVYDLLNSHINFARLDSLTALMEFKETFGGNARLRIDNLFNPNGESILN